MIPTIRSVATYPLRYKPQNLESTTVIHPGTAEDGTDGTVIQTTTLIMVVKVKTLGDPMNRDLPKTKALITDGIIEIMKEVVAAVVVVVVGILGIIPCLSKEELEHTLIIETPHLQQITTGMGKVRIHRMDLLGIHQIQIPTGMHRLKEDPEDLMDQCLPWLISDEDLATMHTDPRHKLPP